MSSSKVLSFFAFVVVFVCMVIHSANAYTTNQRTSWFPAKPKAGPVKNCKLQAEFQANDEIKKQCSTLSGSAYKNCANNLKALRRQLTGACVTQQSKYSMYIARNTPIDLLNGILIPNVNGTIDDYGGRVPLDGNEFYKINYENEEIKFYRSGYKYKAVGTYTVEFNGATYVMAGFHFHKPAEHTFSGTSAGMEIHFVHILLDGPDAGALVDPDKYLVLGFMLEKFAECTSGTDNETKFDGAINQDDFYSVTITPKMVSRIYTYEGGLTTLPYTTRVRWTLSPYYQNSNAIMNWPGDRQIPKDLYPKPTRLGYPDRPPLRALLGDVTLLERDTSEGYYYNGCPATP